MSLELQKVVVMSSKMDQMVARLQTEGDARKRMETRINEYYTEVQNLKEAMLMAATDYAALEDALSEQMRLNEKLKTMLQANSAASKPAPTAAAAYAPNAALDDMDGYDTAASDDAESLQARLSASGVAGGQRKR